MGNCFRSLFPNSVYSLVYDEKLVRKQHEKIDHYVANLKAQEDKELVRLDAAQEQVAVLEPAIREATHAHIREKRPRSAHDTHKVTRLRLQLSSKMRALSASTSKLKDLTYKLIAAEEARSRALDSNGDDSEVRFFEDMQRFEDRRVKNNKSNKDNDKDKMRLAEKLKMQGSEADAQHLVGAQMLAEVLKKPVGSIDAEVEAMFEEAEREAFDHAALSSSAIEIEFVDSHVSAPAGPLLPPDSPLSC